MPAPSVLAIWRPAFEVFHTSLPPDEAEAVRRARAGATLEEVCAAFALRPEPAQAAFAALASWLDEGWIVGVERSDMLAR